MYNTIEEAYEAFQREASTDRDNKLAFLAGAIAGVAVVATKYPQPELSLFYLRLATNCKLESDKLMEEQ